jgi:cytochrome c-type biogenesis protein CcsB
MTTNDTWSGYSDLALQSSFVVLLLAFVLLTIEYAQSRSKAVEASERELVGAGGPAVAADKPGKLAPLARRSFGERCGNMGRAVAVVGTLLVAFSVVARGIATQRFPLGNMYEFVAIAVAAALIVGLFTLRGRLKMMWVFLLAPVLLAIFLDATVLFVAAGDVPPALQSFWLPIHVTVVASGAGIMLVAGVASCAYLFKVHYGADSGRKGVLARAADILPSAVSLDRLAYRTTIFAFPLFGAGIILGAIWAEAAWGRFWGWDPKETVSLITWLMYAAYLHARATAGWKNTTAAWINVSAFIVMLFNLFAINYIVSGLHSYAPGAGLN